MSKEEIEFALKIVELIIVILQLVLIFIPK